MYELLQKHGCSNVFSLPEGLKELMSDISREVLREQPPVLYQFIANYLSALLITREHGILAVRILDDLCDCRPTVTKHLHWMGIGAEDVKIMAEIIKKGIEGRAMFESSKVEGEGEGEGEGIEGIGGIEGNEETEAEEGHETVREMEIMKQILNQVSLNENMCAKVCQVIRNAYRDYWYRKKLLQMELKLEPETPWEIAAEHTLNLYKKTKPSLIELNRASERIQAAYKGYHVRKNILAHLKKPKGVGPKREMPGPPLDIADSREIDLGDVIKLQVKEDNISEMFMKKGAKDLSLGYEPMKAITLDESTMKTVKIQSRESVSRVYEEPEKSLTMAQEAVKEIIINTPKLSSLQFQMPKDIFLSPVPSKTEVSDDKIVVVVPPKQMDSVCMCEEDSDDPSNVDQRIGVAQVTMNETSESAACRCLRQTISMKQKLVSVSSKVRSSTLEVTPMSSPTDLFQAKDSLIMKEISEAKKVINEVKKEVSEVHDSKDDMLTMMPFDEPPSETIVVTDTVKKDKEVEKKDDEDKMRSQNPVVIQTLETFVRHPALPFTLPAIPEVDEKISTSTNPSDLSDSESSEPTDTLTSTSKDTDLII